MVKKTIYDFFNDHGMNQAAAIAFCAISSLAPLLLIIVSISGFIAPYYSVQIVNLMTSQVGPEVGNSIKSLLFHLEQNRGPGIVSLVIGGIALILASTGLMGNVQHALNIMWRIKPESKNVIKDYFLQKLLSLLLIFVAGVILIH
jgi:membrane protein